jgi:hypothetical protein
MFYFRSMVCAVVFVCCGAAATSQAVTFNQYCANVRQAIIVLENLKINYGRETSAEEAAAFRAIRKFLPAEQKVELFDGKTLNADSSWLLKSLEEIEKPSNVFVAESVKKAKLQAIVERLNAIEKRLADLEKSQSAARAANADKQKLEEILRRPEYQKPSEEKENSLLQKWINDFVSWLSSLFGTRSTKEEEKPVAPAVDLSPIGSLLNYLIIVVALAIIGFVVWRVALPFVKNRSKRPKRRGEKEPRVILGETLAPDATADDLLTQADRLAQIGDVRAAIRKGYIALLCDLSDRKLLGLARHKTNRDYLRDLSQRQDILQPMRDATGSFERHWYGGIPANEIDWRQFKAKYGEIVKD